MKTSKETIAQGMDFKVIATNAKIVACLQALSDIGKKDVLDILKGQNSTKKPIRVMFRNLDIYNATNCEAFTTKTNNGGLVIYINEIHKDAPNEAIACLIAHESQHHPMTNTKQEEFKAWMVEIATWSAFVKKNSSVANLKNDLVKRENHIMKLYNQDGGKGAEIEAIIAKNSAYTKLS